MTIAILAVVVLILGFTAFFGAPYVPSRRKELKMLFDETYKLNPNDTLVDLGSGDGVVLRVAREYGASAVGYELGPVYYLLSKILARGDKRQSIHMTSYWSADFPKGTTVVYAFSDGRDIAKVGQLVQEQSDRLQKALTLITLGAQLGSYKPAKTFRAYHIYSIAPCQSTEA